jgi:opine dehydrogenase
VLCKNSRSINIVNTISSVVLKESTTDSRTETGAAAATTTTTREPRDTESPKTSIPTSTRVGIVGAGAIAFGTAAILSKNGHDPMLWSPSGSLSASSVHQTNQEQNDDNSVYIMSTATNCRATDYKDDDNGQLDYDFQPRLATSVKQQIEQNDVIVIAIPANGHKTVMDILVPSLLEVSSKNKNKTLGNKFFHVIISSHSSLGALYLSQQLHQRQTDGECNIVITAWGTTICTARKPPLSTESNSLHKVDINTIRTSVDLCTIPQQRSPEGLQMCQQLFPGIDFRQRDGLLAISLSNVNPQNHLGMALGNISRMDKREKWYQFENTTPKIGSLLEELDRERLDIADALGVKVKTLYEHFALSFHVPITDSISDMSQEIRRRGNDVYGPNTPDSRYILEDVPFGLTLTVALGKLVNRPATLHEAGLKLCSAMYGRDFETENDLLGALGLDSGKIDLAGLQEAARTGILRSLLEET